MKLQVPTLLTALTLVQMAACAPSGSDVLHFAYELTRHGARSPTESAEYSVGPNMLTPQGMRQRLLLGASNNKRYTQDY